MGYTKVWYNVCQFDLFVYFSSAKTADMPQDILNLLVFIEDFIYYAGLSRKVSTYFSLL